MLSRGQKAWSQLARSCTGTEAGGWGSDRKPRATLQAEGREGRGMSSQSEELSSSGWKQITGVSIGSGSNQEGKVRPAWRVRVGQGLKFKGFLRMTQIPETPQNSHQCVR